MTRAGLNNVLQSAVADGGKLPRRFLEIRSRATRRHLVALVALLCSGFLPCCTPTEVCGNSAEVWIHRVVPESENCYDCMTLNFSTPIVEGDSFRILRDPDHVIERCDIQMVEVRSDGGALMLSRKGYEPIVSFRSSMTEQQSGQLMVLRLERREDPFAVLRVEDLRRRLPLFDFESEARLEQFVRELGADEAAISRAAPPEIQVTEDSETAREAEALLNRLEQEDPALDRLRNALDRGRDDEVVREIVDELKHAQSGSSH